ncbi:hypothetical protein LAZ67_8002973 [Cordylochernes scorpioides]|uniref:Mos1 transposase HTH domain-containing protein n=1 Tax=Cordylochernes scorpioides TaxID=51811 RepID=A0ABY6KRB6_9ARAC|nr:hypothetical protein LAZ67_8002973 [Cordylochernes scorpioides]
MAISEPKIAHLREGLLFAFNWKKSATEAHRMLEEVYSDHALSKSQCYRWFKKFQSGDFELDNEPHGKPPQEFEDAELQALLDEDSTQMQEKLAKQLQRCGDFTTEQKLKQMICIEFCVILQILATETFEMLNKAFLNDAPNRTTVFEWHSRFKAGRISIEDNPRQGRPKFQRTDENVQKFTNLIKENPRTTLLELEQDTGISKTTIGRIVTEDLNLKKTPAKFIPRFLTNEQKLCRLATCEDMLEMTRTDPEWKDKIITGDETWVYGYDPETKRQSAE